MVLSFFSGLCGSMKENERGLADFDIRQNLSVNYIWEVPSLKAKPRALQWALNVLQ
jgi:hypothetical protein